MRPSMRCAAARCVLSRLMGCDGRQIRGGGACCPAGRGRKSTRTGPSGGPRPGPEAADGL
eukprot:7565400-Alexandrium_andersonii.AAC.1